MAEMKSTRDAFGEILVELGKENRDLVVLSADLSQSVRVHLFRQTFPRRFINVGIAEQDLFATAAGMALGGKLPVAATYAVFAGRAYDQIRLAICYPGLRVLIVGGQAGLSAGKDGASHQMLEDLALMRVLPKMTVVVPSDANETTQAVRAILTKCKGPCYLRLDKESLPIVTKLSEPFEIGRAKLVRPGGDVTLIACGSMVHLAREAAEQLAGKKIACRVLNLHTIKPLDTEAILAAARETRGIVTLEEHSVIGGVGSAVAETVVRSAPCPVRMIGVEDRFGESGAIPDLYKLFGLTVERVVKEAAGLAKG